MASEAGTLEELAVQYYLAMREWRTVTIDEYEKDAEYCLARSNPRADVYEIFDRRAAHSDAIERLNKTQAVLLEIERFIVQIGQSLYENPRTDLLEPPSETGKEVP